MCIVNLVNENCHQYFQQKKYVFMATRKELIKLFTLN